MDRKKLREIFLETDICPWLPSLPVPRRRPRFGPYAKRAFLHQLSSCIDAGIDLPRALDLCLQERLPWKMNRSLRKVREALEEGQLFSEALKRHAPRMLPRSFYGVIDIAERSGTLAETMKMLDSHYEKIQSLRRKIFAAMLYPILLSIVGISMMIFLFAKVLPTFAEIFADLDTKLPFLTQKILEIGGFAKSHFLPLSAGIVGLFFVFLLFLFMGQKTALISRILFRIPFFGPLAYHGNVLRFSYMMSLLLRSGATSHEALALCENDLLGPVFRNAIRDARLEISEGRSFSDTRAVHNVFSTTFRWLMSVGEKRGNVADSFSSVAEFEEGKIRETVELFSRVFYPAILISMSVGMAILIVAMWLPVFRMPSLIS